jgi:glycosyltransferase involved in cell wall biosynthesis
VQDSAITYRLSAEDLTARMKYLLDHPERVEELRKLALARVEAAYSWDYLALEYERVLQEVAAR